MTIQQFNQKWGKSLSDLGDALNALDEADSELYKLLDQRRVVDSYLIEKRNDLISVVKREGYQLQAR